MTFIFLSLTLCALPRMTGSSSGDRRMKDVRKKAGKLKRDLCLINRELDDIPADLRPVVDRIVRRAVRSILTYDDLKKVPEQLPLDENGLLKIGPELRAHIIEAREVYAQLDDVRTLIKQLSDE